MLRRNVPVGALVRRLPQRGMPAYMVTAVQFERLECGCLVEFGIRVDSKERAMLAGPCETHRDAFGAVLLGLMDDEETDTIELLERLISDLDKEAV